MSKLTLSRTEFMRQMRKYSDSSSKEVDHAIWKRLKQVAMDPQSIEFNIVDEHNGCAFIEVHSRRGDGFRFSTKTHSSLPDFINFIFATNDMSTTCSSVSTNTYIPRTYNLNINPDAINSNTIHTSTAPTNTSLDIDFIDVKTKLAELAKQQEEEKKSMFNFDFGKVTSDAVRISMYGIAVKNVDGRYVSYDSKTHSVMDVEILNMPADNFLYKMPAAIKDIKAGDVVIHNRVPMFVVETHESTMKVIDIREGTEKEIYLTKSPFGFNFATKIVSLLDMTNTNANEDNPFGTMLPFMLMGDNKNIDPMMLMLASGNKMDMSNPMMMYFLMKDNPNQDMLPLMLMMNTK